MKLIKNADIYAPMHIGIKDVLIGAGKILLIDDKIDCLSLKPKIIDAGGKKLMPGLIDQHIHITGAGGQAGFS